MYRLFDLISFLVLFERQALLESLPRKIDVNEILSIKLLLCLFHNVVSSVIPFKIPTPPVQLRMETVKTSASSVLEIIKPVCVADLRAENVVYPSQVSPVHQFYK